MKTSFNINRKISHYQRRRLIERNYYQHRFFDNSMFIKRSRYQHQLFDKKRLLCKL